MIKYLRNTLKKNCIQDSLNGLNSITSIIGFN